VTVNETPGPRLRLLISRYFPTNFERSVDRKQVGRAAARGVVVGRDTASGRFGSANRGQEISSAHHARNYPGILRARPQMPATKAWTAAHWIVLPQAGARSARPTQCELRVARAVHRAVRAGPVTDAPAHVPRSRAVGATCRLNRMIIQSLGGDGTTARPRCTACSTT